MDDDSTYNIRVYRTEMYKGARVTTYRVRWRAGDRLWREGFRNAALADSFRSSLLTAARKGEAFGLTTGRPVSWKRDEAVLTWYALTLDYTAAKWPYAQSPQIHCRSAHRRHRGNAHQRREPPPC
jgi:hypothetical protein